MITPIRLTPNGRVPDDLALICKVQDNFSENSKTYYLYRFSSVAVFYSEKPHRLRDGEMTTTQFCLPYTGLCWLAESIRGFYTAPADGGQPAGKIGAETKIEGEHLLLHRAASIEGTSYSGFVLCNLSREVYGRTGRGITQELPMTDSFLKRSDFLHILKGKIG